MKITITNTSDFPTVQDLNTRLLSLDPKQEKFLSRRFSSLSKREKRNIEEIALKCVELAGDHTDQCIEDYLWYCKNQVEEELFFRRNGRYRRTTFQECVDDVYSDLAYMTRYMNALLFTQVWWSNHTELMSYYREAFLPLIPVGGRHLEIGPGHGMLLYFACQFSPASTFETWDVSQASLDSTERSLKRMGVSNLPVFRLQDMMEADRELWDTIVLSEVLEHLQP